MEGGERLLGWPPQSQWGMRVWRGHQRGRQGQTGDDLQNRGSLIVGTAMAAEVTGACALTEILDLVFTKCVSIQNLNRCIDKNLEEQ